MRYLSVCSGVEAASLAWEPLGWHPVGFAEIDKFPTAVLAHRFPAVRNFGDFTGIRSGDVGTVDLLVGGTPCQSFSIAGQRLGLDDPRGNLTIEFCRLARRTGARWLLWENVPGVLSHDGGRTFGAILRLMGECGYGFAWRVLDAQYVRVDGFPRAVPQRRRRIFIIGYFGDWRPPAAVLFEPEGMRWDHPPRRAAGEAAGATSGARAASGGGLVAPTVSSKWAKGSGGPAGDECQNQPLPRGEGHDAGEDGTGRGTPLVPIAWNLRGRDGGAQFEGPSDAASLRAADGGSSRSYLTDRIGLRRLTPRECERLQGMPDDWTLVPWRGKLAGDGPRYKAIGNSMAVNVMRWIGTRISAVEGVMAARRGAMAEQWG